jgi:phosphoadenosine phosphosulfate reductase
MIPFQHNQKAILQFSGGKDSAAVLHLLRHHVDHFTVVWCDTGKILPEIEDFIRGLCEKLGAKLEVIRPAIPLEEYHAQYGLPADIVPLESTVWFERKMHASVEQRLQSYADCCAAMIWLPFVEYIKEKEITVVIRGSKKADARVGVPNLHEENGVTYWSPIWDWSHEDVMEYLRRNNVRLPPHYDFFWDSLDCWTCTGHLKHCGAGRLAYVKEFHPDKWPELKRRIHKVNNEIARRMSDIAPALRIAEDG